MGHSILSIKNNVVMLLAVIAFLSGCDNGISEKYSEQKNINSKLILENKKLKDKVAKLEAENEELSNTPERLLSKISVLINQRLPSKAESAFALLKVYHPGVPEVKIAEKRIAELKRKLKSEREEAERKQRLGFKAIKSQKTFSIPGLKVKVRKAKITKQWIFDSYNHEYHYRNAERGNKFITAQLSITADQGVKDPMLPGIGVYAVAGNRLRLLENLDYEFVRWEDYGSYLGNYADYKNDFAHTATIPFSVGGSVAESSVKKPLFLIATNSGCHTRTYDRFSNPPVDYVGVCSQIKSELTLDEVSSKKYFVLNVWNAKKL